MAKSTKDNALNHCAGSSNTSTRIWRMLSKLATVCSDWDFQHMLCSHLKILDCVHWEFQLVTAIHEKLREIRCMPRSSKFEILSVLPACFRMAITSVALGVPMQFREF